jgi:hypothetical protein
VSLFLSFRSSKLITALFSQQSYPSFNDSCLISHFLGLGLNSMTIPGSRNIVLWSCVIEYYKSESVGRVLIAHFGVACDPPHSVAEVVHQLIALLLHSAVLKRAKLLQDTAKLCGRL